MRHALAAAAAALLMTTLLMTGPAGAATRMTLATHTEGYSFQGQQVPDSSSSSTVWLDEGRLRSDEGERTTLVRLDLDTMYLIDHAAETVAEVQLPVDLRQLIPPAVAEQMLRMMAYDVTVEPTDDTRQIGDWSCRAWNITMSSEMMLVSSRFWATTDTPVDHAAYVAASRPVLSLQPGLDELAEQMAAIDGLVVVQETQMTAPVLGDRSILTSVETREITEVEPPEGWFEPPADYRPVELDYLAWMEERRE